MYSGLKFHSKADLLRWLGKDSKDVRLVDRMMRRGEVVKENGEYILPLRKEVEGLMEMVLGLCDDEKEKELMLGKMYKVLYNKGNKDEEC